MALDPFDVGHGSHRVSLNGLAGGDWLEAGVFSVGVGLTPEMLPMIITASLVKVPLSYYEEKVVIKKRATHQDLGAIDILCTG